MNYHTADNVGTTCIDALMNLGDSFNKFQHFSFCYFDIFVKGKEHILPQIRIEVRKQIVFLSINTYIIYHSYLNILYPACSSFIFQQ